MEKTHVKKVYAIVALILVTLLLSAAVSMVFAKYASYQDRSQTVSSPNFYFRSDLLSEEGTEHVYSAATTSFYFYLYNYDDDLRISMINVDYTVVVKCDGNTVYTVGGSLPAGEKTAQKITVPSLNKGKTYEVEVLGEQGFEKTLRGSFTINDESGFYKAIDSSDPYYVILRVWTADSSGSLVITPPAALIPDNTWEGMEDVDLGGTIEETLGEYSSKIYRYLKPADYAGGYDFSAKLNGVEAELQLEN